MYRMDRSTEMAYMEAFYSGTVGIKGKHWPHVRPALTKPCTASNIQLSLSRMQKAMQGMVRFQPCPLPSRAVNSPSACLPHTHHPQPTSRPRPHTSRPTTIFTFSATHFSTHSRHPRATSRHGAPAASSTTPPHACHALLLSSTHFCTHFLAPQPLCIPGTLAPSFHALLHALLRIHKHRIA